VKKLLLVLPLIFLVMPGCISVTKQPRNTTILDVSQEDKLGGTGTSSADIRSMAERMAREISGIKWPEGKHTTRIALTDVDNQTRFAINPNIIKDRLLTDLIELASGTGISYTENQSQADYFLSSRITALSKGSADGVSDYLLYTFKLVDRADTVIWMKAYETKKQGKTGVMYR
jgi:hypothetical protein